jgi:hypothetical protein
MHTTTFAALANMSPHCQNLHAYAAQRMVGTLAILARKYERVSLRVRALATASSGFHGLDSATEEQEIAVRLCMGCLSQRVTFFRSWSGFRGGVC